MTIHDFLQTTIDKKASDLHLVSGYPAFLRIDGVLSPLDSMVLDGPTVNSLVSQLLTTPQKDFLTRNLELDFGFGFATGRFRTNVYMAKGTINASFRLIPHRIPTIEELGLPSICHNFASLKQGFILVTGPTGQGKSTTIAAIIEEINQTIGGHILTIEDPIEYLYSPSKAIVSQREINTDARSWSNSLKSALREDPNVVLVGEMRDFETISAALTIAETGHLVFATLHTNSASQTLDRIIDVFPQNQQAQVRMQLSNTLEAVFSQRLVPAVGGGRVPAVEVLLATPAVRSIIREGKSHLVDNVIQTSRDLGMLTFDMSLAQLSNSSKITYETATSYATNPQEFAQLIKKI